MHSVISHGQHTLSGIHMIFVVGYGWSNVFRDTKSAVSSSKDTICTCNHYTHIPVDNSTTTKTAYPLN